MQVGRLCYLFFYFISIMNFEDLGSFSIPSTLSGSTTRSASQDDNEIAVLREQVQDLIQRVTALEGRAATPAAPIPAATPTRNNALAVSP